ncbi:Ferric enterobactin transport ATP-binding protein FepC [Sporomusa carbonis]|uniref:ABC transporter ATP-binding protein n=1 Tax=Sporomusa carbonis TaxID=3076075 RepID=UPI003A6CCFD2
MIYADSPLLKVNMLTAGYNQAVVMEGINLSLCPGQFLSVVAPNGTGKTTLIRCLAGVLPPIKGAISLCGCDITCYSRRDLAKVVAVAGQNEQGFDYTVRETVAMGRYPHSARFTGETQEDRDIIEQALLQVGMWEKRDINFNRLSQGERQKVTIARALAQCPKILLLDEPTSHLDIRNQIEVLRLVKRLVNDRRLAVLAVIHDINLAVHFSTHLALLNNGKMIAYGRTGDVLSVDILRGMYGVDFKLHRDAKGLFLQPDYDMGE